VEPESILASSFSKATVADLKDGVKKVGVPGADCRTLHSLGQQFIRYAEEKQHWPPRLSDGGDDKEQYDSILAYRAIRRLAREMEVDSHAIGIDAKDLKDQISAWKGDLAYADLEKANLPAPALKHASQAGHRNALFVKLYQYYEEERAREKWITFDDMLLEGWEALVRFPDVRQRAQSQYEYVLIDEFQDVNRVQYLMLDILTEQRRNYMAIGDDDQCIYEWRGANPNYILDFCKEYGAKEYIISDNFRSKIQQTSLANAVIEHNKNRRGKHINLTRGLDGRTRLIEVGGSAEEAENIVDIIRSHLENGLSTKDMVVLVRQYSQTPFIEQALIGAEIPYKVVGNSPFYLRKQVQVLLRFLYWAMMERTVQKHGWFESRRRSSHYVDRFQKIIREPNRFISADIVQRIGMMALKEKTSLLDVMTVHMADMADKTAERVEEFLGIAEELVRRLDDPADQTVAWLIEALDYEAYIRERSAFVEIADGRVNTAKSLITFATGHATVMDLLDHIRRISFNQPEKGPGEDALKISSIHRSKGGQWPVVFIPGCNDGTIPVKRSEPALKGPTLLVERLHREQAELLIDAEEERRLFYVAITRAQKELNIYYDRNEPISPFLREARAEKVLTACNLIRAAAEKSPGGLSDEEARHLCRGIDTLRLKRFVEKWWKRDDAYKAQLAQRIQHVEEVKDDRSDSANPSMEQEDDVLQSPGAFERGREVLLGTVGARAARA
jgi:DNA helicase-2/ATP-dependent DNA helicase PcrA